MENSLIAYLDKLPDDGVLDTLYALYGHYEPVWEECTEKEYNKGMAKIRRQTEGKIRKRKGARHQLTKDEEFIAELEEWLIAHDKFKVEPVYSDWKGGLLNLLELQEDREPDYYRYYKRVGTQRVFMLGSRMAEYLAKRNIKIK